MRTVRFLHNEVDGEIGFRRVPPRAVDGIEPAALALVRLRDEHQQERNRDESKTRAYDIGEQVGIPACNRRHTLR